MRFPDAKNQPSANGPIESGVIFQTTVSPCSGEG